MLFSAFSFITSSQIASHAATSVISEGYSADKSVKWTVTDDGTMTIVPTNGKEGTLIKDSYDDEFPNFPNNWPFETYHRDDGVPVQNELADKITRIVANTGTIHVNNCRNLFYAFKYNNPPTFENKNAPLKYIDISSFDTRESINFAYMFDGQMNLIEIKTGAQFKGTKAKKCVSMFENCTNLKTVNLSTFDTPICTQFNRMFMSTRKLKELNFNSFDTTATINKTLSGLSTDEYLSVYGEMNAFSNGCNSLEKVTFGTKCIGKYDVQNLNYSNTFTTDLGLPYALSDGLFGPGPNSYKWTKVNSQYMHLTSYEIQKKCKTDSSFKLAGTWIRDDVLPQYNVTFKDGYMKNTISTKSVSEGSNIAKYDFPSVKSYASDGIKFEGWFDESNRECTSGYTNVTKNMTLTARYRPYRITAKFICDDGSEAHIDMNTAYRTKITMPKYTGKVPTSKIFAMWSIKQLDGNTKLLHDGETIDVPVVAKCPTDDNGTITFKAVFTAVKNPDTNQNTNQADVPAPTPDTNKNVPIATSPEPKNEPAPAPATDPKPAAQPVSDIVQTGVEILPAALAASAASIAAILIRRRTK